MKYTVLLLAASITGCALVHEMPQAYDGPPLPPDKTAVIAVVSPTSLNKIDNRNRIDIWGLLDARFLPHVEVLAGPGTTHTVSGNYFEYTNYSLGKYLVGYFSNVVVNTDKPGYTYYISTSVADSIPETGPGEKIPATVMVQEKPGRITCYKIMGGLGYIKKIAIIFRNIDGNCEARYYQGNIVSTGFMVHDNPQKAVPISCSAKCDELKD